MIRQRLKLFFACVLTVVCAASAIRAVKVATVAYSLNKTRYGLFQSSRWEQTRIDDPEEIIHRARIAEKLFPENYYFFEHTALMSLEAARVTHGNGDYENYRRFLDIALHFAQTALALNPYGEMTRTVYADVLVENGNIAEAVDFWRDKVIEREFWVGISHDKMASLLLKSNDPEHIREAVKMVPPNNGLWLVRDPDLRRKLTALKNLME
ncbi:MAG: hypothetical protein FWG05_02030 [Kiritimatiellaeota bacterium]|nr:hypothetical protein [Kiritimatiellota bacterium]